jgi:hypothetical protein
MKKKEVMHLVPEKNEKREDSGFGFNASSLVGDGDALPALETNEPAKKKRGRPRKEDNGDGFTVAKKADPNPINSDMPYDQTYKQNMMMMSGTVAQIDGLSSQLMQDLGAVRNLRNSFKKYEYMGTIAGAVTSLIGNKISAVREMNSVITKCHDLELKRAKELKAGVDDGDDDKRLMDLYSAFINNPMGNPGASMPYANVSQADLMSVGARANTTNLFSQNEDPGFTRYEQNLTPQQNAMLNEGNPNIETVLVYDQSTQDKYFEVIDKSTGMPIPNMPTPGEFILEGCVPDVVRGIARNSDFNQNFPLKLVGQRAANEY